MKAYGGRGGLIVLRFRQTRMSLTKHTVDMEPLNRRNLTCNKKNRPLTLCRRPAFGLFIQMA